MTILTRTDADGIAALTLNDPGTLNALSDAMLAALADELDRIAQDESVRVVTLQGAGRAFCAGHHLGEMRGKSPEALHALFETCTAVMLRLQSLPQPVIAQVHGLATAAGCQLVATCDLAVAAEDARFGVNGVDIGLFCSTPMVALTRNIARKQAFEMLVTGDFIDAARAVELGLVNHAVPSDKLPEVTRDLALRIAGKRRAAVRIGKRAFYEQTQMDVAAAYAHTGRVMVANMAEPDTVEGIAAFVEKRDPGWK